ncbi:hypothetical protein P3T76_008609 [Phytophthora citrophthora]|uniref:Uncharacterized protein n=1 Tax=Phytophthora citrophthora TaxID=4793 RepID=A0AAD9GIV2_9STRA|nr:hypothetical protein P3T76_008609 [Phytophthora citrophthora]
METEDVADSVVDIRRYWGSDNDYTDEEIFAFARCKWEISKRSANAAKEFVLQVVASRLEEQLLTWLLQSHTADAVEDIQMLVFACMHPYFTSKGLVMLLPMLDTLLTLTILRATGCDRDSAGRKQRMADILGRMEDGVFRKGKAWRILRKLNKSELKDDEEAWMKFLELSNVLDPRAFNSRSGRTLVDEANQVIWMQHVELAAVRGSISDVELGREKVASELWDIAEQLVEFIDGKTAPIAEPRSTTNDLAFAFDVTLVTDFEEYLKLEARNDPPGMKGISGHEASMINEDIELSATEQLSRICSSLKEEELVISSDILEKVFAELSAIKRVDTVSIHVSFLLGMQMRLKYCFIDHCKSSKLEFERRIKRVLNRLAGKDQDLDHAASLIILSAFCPGQIIHECIRGARTGVLHHDLCLKVLQASPLLLEWHEASEDGSKNVFELELQTAVLDISRNQGSFDRESHNVISFLLSLVGFDGSTSLKRGTSLVTVSKLISGLVHPVWCCLNQSVEMQLNLLTLIQQLFQHFVATSAKLEISPASLQASFDLAFEALCSARNDDPKVGALIRERLLLILKNTMELMSDPVSMTRLEQLNNPLNASLWTLISLFSDELGNEELCKGLEDVAAVEAYMQTRSVDDTLSLPKVISAIQGLLWGLLWDSILSKNVSVESTKSETWKFLDTIASFEFCGSESPDETIKGSFLIESAVAEMMLECGNVLFRALLCNIVPFLLEYEPTENFQEEKLTIPQWATGKLPENPEIQEQIPCWLVSTHLIMRYVAKSWGLSGLANRQLNAQSNVLVLTALTHVVTAHDQAITASKGSLSGTLFCIQWLSFLVSAAHELHFDTLSASSSVKTQLELSFLRLLHQLEHVKGISEAEAKFSQHFVAAWLGYLPVDQFEQVFKFISTKRNN